MKVSRLCLQRLSVNATVAGHDRYAAASQMQSTDSYTSMFLCVIVVGHLRNLRIEDMLLKVLEVAPEPQGNQ